MSFLIIAMLCGLAFLTVWGFISPRGQWRVLTSWSRRDPYDGNPGSLVAGIHRGVAGLGVVVLVLGVLSMQGHPGSVVVAKPIPRGSEVRTLWGSPNPMVVNRVIEPLAIPPSGFVQQPILRYQVINGPQRNPSYLFTLPQFNRSRPAQDDGYVGMNPSIGLTALDSADIVLQVRGDRNCIPRAVVAIESATNVRLAVYYSRPGGSVTDPTVPITACVTVAPDSKSYSVLIPVQLSGQVLSRTVTNLDGTPIAPVHTG